MKKEVLTHEERIQINDYLNFLSQKKKNFYSPVIGLVRIYQDGILNTDDSEDGWLTNMTIASGREFIAQAITKKFHQSSIFGNVSNYKVDAFGVGSKGTSIDENENVILHGPTLFDMGLYQPIQLNSQCLATFSHSDRQNPIPYVVKFIESTGPGNLTGSIEFETSQSSEFANSPFNYYTVIKMTCIVEPNEPMNLNPGESVKIDEAMLFATSPNNQNPLPFAHICFSPKFVELESEFRIIWYIIA